MWGVTLRVIPASFAYSLIINWIYLELRLVFLWFTNKYSFSTPRLSKYSCIKSRVSSSKITILSLSPFPLTLIVLSFSSIVVTFSFVSSDTLRPVEYRRVNMSLFRSLVIFWGLVFSGSYSLSLAWIKSYTSCSFNDLGNDFVLFGALISSYIWISANSKNFFKTTVTRYM